MKGRAFYFFALAIAAVLFCSLQYRAQGVGDRNRAADGGDGTYGVQGRVYLPNGKPAINAKIYINSADSIAVTTVTDLNGMFQVGSLRAGNYSIVISVEGFPSERETVIIDRFAPAGRTFPIAVHFRSQGRREPEQTVDPKFQGVPKHAVDKYTEGVEKLRQNDLKAAVALFDEAIAAHANFAAAYYEKGTAHLKANSLDKALEAFVKAVSIDQEYFEAKYSVGYTQYLKKNYEVASAIFIDVLKQRRDFAEAYMYLGISLYYLKNAKDAETALKAAVSITNDARVALAHRFLGGLYIQADRKGEAAAELQKYLDLVPSAPDAGRLRSTIEDLKKKS